MDAIDNQYHSLLLTSGDSIKVFVPFELSKKYPHDPHLQDYLYYKREFNCSIDTSETCHPEGWGTKINLEFKIVPKVTQLFTDISLGGFAFRLLIRYREEVGDQLVSTFDFPSCKVANLSFYNHVGLLKVTLVTTA